MKQYILLKYSAKICLTFTDHYSLNRMEQTLHYISEIIIERGNTVSSSGLLHGKMGLAVFFFHYARFTGDSSFEDRAMSLIDCIQEQILQQYEMDYANGLAGIGAGIEYLAQNGFVDVDTNEILDEIDHRIFLGIVFQTPTDIDVLVGLGHYLLFRIHNAASSEHNISTLNNKMLLLHLVDLLEQTIPQQGKDGIACIYRFLTELDKTDVFPVKVKRLIKDIRSQHRAGGYLLTAGSYHRQNEKSLCRQYKRLLTSLQKDFTPDIMLQLFGGLAGIGLYLMGILDARHRSWFQLIN